MISPTKSPRGLVEVPRALALAGLVILASGCSIRGYALRATADALSGQGGGFGEDDDPLLVRDAAPFALKTMESLAKEVPDHKPLHLALASGFVQYGYAFVQQDADRAEDKNLQQARAGWLRARRLYLRGRNYALKGLDLAHPGLRKALLAPEGAGRDAALQQAKAEDVPLLYWAAAGWALAISTAKDEADLVGDLPVVEALMKRALSLQEDYDRGALHEFYVTYDGGSGGAGPAKAKEHLDRALALSKGQRLGPLVSYAEGVLVQKQDKKEFTRVLQGVVDTNILVEEEGWRRERLANTLSQQRARWLLSKVGDLFAD